MKNITEHLRGLIKDEKDIQNLKESLEPTDLVSESLGEYDGKKISEITPYERRKIAKDFLVKVLKGAKKNALADDINLVNVGTYPKHILDNIFKGSEKAKKVMLPIFNLVKGLDDRKQQMYDEQNALYRKLGIEAKSIFLGKLPKETPAQSALYEEFKEIDSNDFVILGAYAMGDNVKAFVENGGSEKDFKSIGKNYKDFSITIDNIGGNPSVEFEGTYKPYVKGSKDIINKIEKSLKNEVSK